MKRLVNKRDLMNMLEIDYELESFEKLSEMDLVYREVGGAERDIEILNCIKRIQNDIQIVGTPERTVVWENGWNENLEEFRYNLDTRNLYPKYFHSEYPIRFKGDFIKSDNPKFQMELDLLVKRCLFEIYAKEKNNIYEFGCGTGYNLVMLSEMYPDKYIYGLDFTKSGVEILKILHDKLGRNIDGYQFDFTKPDNQYSIKRNNAVFTFAALEQVGEKCRDFIRYLMENGAETIVHLEPIVELYDENNLLDYLAKTFHKKRHYLSGLLPYLRELEVEGEISVEKICRLHLGNHNHEGYTLIVWHPGIRSDDGIIGKEE